ncbi:VapE domain-containing protein [Agrobacterium larrymoorei]|uniref:VapE domain-containing protein n=1 Tax=Agrobacterium larrymoorei TaxID=160699 RepID=UPI0030C3D5A3
MTDENVIDLNETKRSQGRHKSKAAPRFNWAADLLVDGDSGKIINCLPNAIRSFEIAPQLRGCIGFNEMTGQVSVLKPLPAVNAAAARDAGRTIDDVDIVLLQEWLQLEAMWPSLPKASVIDAVEAVARANRFHPVRDYLSGLEWDGRARVGGWLSSYLGARSNPYTNNAGTMWLIAAVARIFEPGCQADYMVVLEGEQGEQKSTALRILGGEWFGDQLPGDLSSKDSSIVLRGKWIIEASEMASMNRADTNVLKAFVTRRIEDYRPPHARFNVTVPRQCVFAGTINPGANGYLKDATGGRRFWPIKIGKLSIPKLRHDRDQLWAEAVQLYRQGVHWWPDRDFERKVFAPAQDDARELDPWEDIVSRYLEGRSSISMAELATDCLSLSPRDYRKDVQVRIGECLRSLGWRKGSKDPKTRRQLFVRDQ